MSLPTRLLGGPAVAVVLAGVPSGRPVAQGRPRRLLGAVRLRLPGDDALSAALGGASSLLAVVALFDATVVLLFGVLFIRRVTGPLHALAQATHSVAAGQLDLPALPVGSAADEVAQL